MRSYRRRSSKKWLFAIILLALTATAFYIYTAKEFEQEAPRIQIKEGSFWNRNDPLMITLEDNVALRSFQVRLSDGTNEVIVGKGEFEPNTNRTTLAVRYPDKGGVLDSNAQRLYLHIDVTDRSLWNFFRGNKTHETKTLQIDTQPPKIEVLSHSYSITQGGSALVVFQALDDHLESVKIKTPTKTFYARPYKKEGYFIALIAWPFQENSFQAHIVAKDKAGNVKQEKIPFYLKSRRYRVSLIRATDRFIDGKIKALATAEPEFSHIDDRIERFRAVNETMRLQNEALIHELSASVGEGMLQEWNIGRFHPLKGSVKVANFGDKRHYYYQEKQNRISTSYHLGYDLASTKHAPIIASNPGKVVFAGYNGIYGNMPLIDHGLGLYSLYGHCSKLLVKEGDEVKKGDVIAKTGMSGLALGDHLHFGILVQGIEVRPIEWFDPKWIRTNITKVMEDADRQMLR